MYQIYLDVFVVCILNPWRPSSASQQHGASSTHQPPTLPLGRVTVPSATGHAPGGSSIIFGTGTAAVAAAATAATPFPTPAPPYESPPPLLNQSTTTTRTPVGWVTMPSATGQAPGGSSIIFGTATSTITAAAAAATPFPTPAPPYESPPPLSNQSTTTTTSLVGGDVGINGVTTAFAGMGIPQAGASSNAQSLQPPLQQQQQHKHKQQQPQQPQPQQQQQQQSPPQPQTQRRLQPPQQQGQQQQDQQHQRQQHQQQQKKQKQKEQKRQQQQEQQQEQQQRPQLRSQPEWQQSPSQSPFRLKPIDLRLQMQTSKLAFITSKRSGELIRAGFTLRREAGLSTIQEFLDNTRKHRKPYGGRGLCGFPPCPSGVRGNSSSVGGNGLGVESNSGVGVEAGEDEEGNSGGSANPGLVYEKDVNVCGRGGTKRGNGDDPVGNREDWQDMTLAYSEALGWVYLHHATTAGIELVQELVRTTHGHEMGIFSVDTRASDTILGFASALESSKDVSVVVWGAVVRIWGTLQQVHNVSKAIEAIVSGSKRIYAKAAWYWRGDGATEELCPWFPMSSDANAVLETAFASYNSDDYNLARYTVGSATYEANLKLMAQVNQETGFVRPIRRMVADRQGCPLPRCPKENIPLTNFREGTSYSLIAVSKEEDAAVRAAVTWTFSDLPVVRVEHVWNSFLWGHYAQNAKTVGNECLMFHGARAGVLNQICKTGFDRRLAGSKHGAKYGHGCYFARDASLAALYMNPTGYSQMIMAKVLVGNFTLGDSTMVRPPRMGGTAGDRTYDTTSDRPHSPNLIVTYKDWMAYPMYLITFGGQPQEK